LRHLCLRNLLRLRRERSRHSQQRRRTHKGGELGCCRIHSDPPVPKLAQFR
jgi:hypothetical protein